MHRAFMNSKNSEPEMGVLGSWELGLKNWLPNAAIASIFLSK